MAGSDGAQKKALNRLADQKPDEDPSMPTRIILLVFTVFSLIVWLGTTTLAQDSVGDLHKILREKAAFEETDFAALEQGRTVVRLLPARDKREVGVCGLVKLQVPAQMFLQSYRESMVRKSNPAILEIGRFSNEPTLADLQTLTFENRDIEDLRECVVGDCRLKLSAAMIERFQNEVNWDAPNYRLQATQLLKQMLLDYVRDYLTRGDGALIEYSDKAETVRLAEEQRALIAGSTYVHNPAELTHYLKDFSKVESSLVESAIVWSKIKFGLKPVIAFNHITIYKREQETGPQILITSKQIYANHYFDSSLALTAFVRVADPTPRSYLFYENRSRADGLEGPIGKIKRHIVENKAVDGLKTILDHSKVTLSGEALNKTESAPGNGVRSWRRWKIDRTQVFLCLFVITAFIAWLVLGNYRKGDLSGGAQQ